MPKPMPKTISTIDHPVPPKPSVAQDLFDQPGHLLRRAHQIAGGMFDDLVGLDVTPNQYAILRMVHEQPGIDQVSLARQIGLDTSTAALTAARLGARDLLTRSVSEVDRRLLRLTLTAQGEALLESTVGNVRQMREKLLSSLPPEDREVFMALLRKFVHINNEQSRAPLRAKYVAESPAALSPRKAKPSSATKP
jgi:DNA-binding MarR family transcriptional regulator